MEHTTDMAANLIVGLGNPGKRYEKTRHNIGFRVVDVLAERWGLKQYDKCFDAEFDKSRALGKHVLLLRPQTYMNLSGISVSACSKYHKIAPADIWVIHDDLDLPLGKLRISQGGSSGGHNGIGSIITRLGSSDFVRFRIGIGRPAPPIMTENYVVQPFTAGELPVIEEAIGRAADAVETAIRQDVTRAMNQFNR